MGLLKFAKWFNIFVLAWNSLGYIVNVLYHSWWMVLVSAICVAANSFAVGYLNIVIEEAREKERRVRLEL